MQILERIADQLTTTRLPLVGVTLAAVPCPDTPVILTLHWHGFLRERLVESDEAASVRVSPVPSSSLQINEQWHELLNLDLAAMEAGWELGAWDVSRVERPGCMRPGAAAREALECLQAFGVLTAAFGSRELVISEAPDADELVKVAARSGYVTWQFRPVHGGIWGDVAADATLAPDGTRTPPCPHAPVPPSCDGPRQTVYRFGEPADRTIVI